MRKFHELFALGLDYARNMCKEPNWAGMCLIFIELHKAEVIDRKESVAIAQYLMDRMDLLELACGEGVVYLNDFIVIKNGLTYQDSEAICERWFEFYETEYQLLKEYDL